MALFSGIKNRYSEAHFLVLDIGTDTVKAAVLESQGNISKVVGFAEAMQKPFAMTASTLIDINSISKSAEEAIRKAENMAKVRTHKMILGVSGELLKGSTHRSKIIRRDPSQKIDLSELKNAVHKIQWKAFEVIRQEMAFETGYNEIDVKLVNAAIVDISIDKYSVTNPIGFQGKEISMTIFNSFSPIVHYGALQTLAAEIDRELIALVSEPYALASSIDNFSGIIIDIGAGTTDVAISVNGQILGNKMFALGGTAFTKRLAKHLKISMYDAEKIKLSYAEDKLERQSRRIVGEALLNDVDLWLSGVVMSLQEFKNIETLPSDILLSGKTSNLAEIKNALEGRSWRASLPFTKKPQVRFFNPSKIQGIGFDKSLFPNQDNVVSLALAKQGHKFMKEDVVASKVLKKVVRLMHI